MSKKHKSPTTTIISVIVLGGMLASAYYYINVSGDEVAAAQDVWEHFKSISVLVVGYWFGSNR